MLIPEAAQLVIQASAMAAKGEVYVLDMGEPVKILRLAKTMIELAGMSVRNAANPEGDIEIEFSGLRQGEKLFEELNIGCDISQTAHPRIMRSNETYLAWDELGYELEVLDRELRKNNGTQLAIQKQLDIAMRDTAVAHEFVNSPAEMQETGTSNATTRIARREFR
jgi:UDP-N-acetylglucosamine 4,6-dehydratase